MKRLPKLFAGLVVLAMLAITASSAIARIGHIRADCNEPTTAWGVGIALIWISVIAILAFRAGQAT